MSNQTSMTGILAAAFASLFAAGASAQMHPEKPTYPYEKCYSVAKAGHNDCFTPRHSCAGTTEQDNDAQAWVYVPAGTCEKIVGGRRAPG